MAATLNKYPSHYDAGKAGEVWKINYDDLAKGALAWSHSNKIVPSSEDKFKICLLAVDIQNTFCIPGYELFVAGRSGQGAVEDTKRLCEFIYNNLGLITEIIPTMDTHKPVQIFHPLFLSDSHGNHPAPYTLISEDDVIRGKWKINKNVCLNLGIDEEQALKFLLHYTGKLKEGGKYKLTVWPYHAMLGGIGHALVSLFEEAVFFHSIARSVQPDIQIKGLNPLTEHYSVFGPEIRTDSAGRLIADKNSALIEKLLRYDAIIVAGEAKSHCVEWTVNDLLSDFSAAGNDMIEKIYLLDDCTSPVVIPGVIDYTDEAEKSFKKFSSAGMHIVKSTDPLTEWPGLEFLK